MTSFTLSASHCGLPGILDFGTAQNIRKHLILCFLKKFIFQLQFTFNIILYQFEVQCFLKQGVQLDLMGQLTVKQRAGAAVFPCGGAADGRAPHPNSGAASTVLA